MPFTDGKRYVPKGGFGIHQGISNATSQKFHRKKSASVIGRYYAMDRDNRLGTVKLAYDGLSSWQGERSKIS